MSSRQLCQEPSVRVHADRPGHYRWPDHLLPDPLPGPEGREEEDRTRHRLQSLQSMIYTALFMWLIWVFNFSSTLTWPKWMLILLAVITRWARQTSTWTWGRWAPGWCCLLAKHLGSTHNYIGSHKYSVTLSLTAKITYIYKITLKHSVSLKI